MLSAFSAILGPAGSGKSTELRSRAADNVNYARVCATTGIAAVNLGADVTTINSTLGFFNEESAFESFTSGRMAMRMTALANQGFENLVIDEISMMPASTLDLICDARDQSETYILNNRQDLVPVNIIVTGDFLQLPPVRGKFAFAGRAWPAFDPNVMQLQKIYRQTDKCFLEALQLARAGKGVAATIKLKEAGVKFVDARDDLYDGLTIMPTNADADALNDVRFKLIVAPDKSYKSVRWGDKDGSWQDIPETLTLKEGALVTVLANRKNDAPTPGYAYVNGDIGTVVGMEGHCVVVEIRRGATRQMQYVGFEMRESYKKEKPADAAEFNGFTCDGVLFKSPDEIRAHTDDGLISAGEWTQRKMIAVWLDQYDRYTRDAIAQRLPYWSIDKKKWVTGWIEYMPLRLAYATTIHRSQGLTLDAVQIDARKCWRGRDGRMAGAGAPGMMYTALSRCRSAENIRIVCGAGEFGKRVNTAQECLRWV